MLDFSVDQESQLIIDKMSRLVENRKCMKCNVKTNSLLCSFDHLGLAGNCYHIYCRSCFKKENDSDFMTKKPICPCCQKLFFEYIESIEEALLIGEAAYLINDAKLDDFSNLKRDKSVLQDLYKSAMKKYERALLLNPTNIIVMYCILQCCINGYEYCAEVQNNIKPAQFCLPGVQNLLHTSSSERYHCRQRIYDLSFDLMKRAFDAHGKSRMHIICDTLGLPRVNKLEEYYNALGSMFLDSGNIPASFKCVKLAYETCLQSPSQSGLDKYKADYLLLKQRLAEEPPLRFATGEVVEFLYEVDGETEWRLGKIVELYYREQCFPLVFTAPYRLQLLGDSGEVTDPPVYAYVRADLNRYVRKPGVRLMEDTRYQARLDAEVTELAQVYCSKEFIQDIYRALARDGDFVDTLLSEWRITLSVRVLCLYRVLVMYIQPLVRIESGYHVPTAEEVVAGIRAYFDPSDTCLAPVFAASDEGLSDDKRIKAIVIRMLQQTQIAVFESHCCFEIEGRDAMFMRAFNAYQVLYHESGYEDGVNMFTLIANGFSIPLPPHCLAPEISAAVAAVAGAGRLECMIPDPHYAPARRYLIFWKNFVKYLDKSGLGPACECPFVYFFVKFCLDQGVGVPKPALVVYDRMNMQLSREFIRCANPSCELNRLDQSTGQVKFKKCSRCQAVIYCSRECQVAHYSEHKRLCREHSTG